MEYEIKILGNDFETCNRYVSYIESDLRFQSGDIFIVNSFESFSITGNEENKINVLQKVDSELDISGSEPEIESGYFKFVVKKVEYLLTKQINGTIYIDKM